MNPGCSVGSRRVLTADDRYFQKPPAEQFISLSSCTALLNNAQWQKTLEARCSDAQLCIHEELISAAATLFIRPLHVFMFYTPCRKSRHLSQLQLSLSASVASSSQCFFFLSVVFAWWAVWFSSGPWRVFLCLSSHLLVFALRRFTSSFVWMKQHIWLCQSLPSKLKVTARSLLFHFSLQCHNVEQRKRSDKHRSNSIVCLILAICNYTYLFWVMFLQWVLWGTTIWLALQSLLFVIFLRVCNQTRLFLISYCLLNKFYYGRCLWHHV